MKRIRKKKLCLFPDVRDELVTDFKGSKTLKRIQRIETQGRKQNKPLSEVATHCSKVLGEQLRKSAKKSAVCHHRMEDHRCRTLTMNAET